MSPLDIHAGILILFLCLSIAVPVSNPGAIGGLAASAMGLISGVALAGYLITTQVDASAVHQPYRAIAVASFSCAIVVASARNMIFRLGAVLILVPLAIFVCDQHRKLLATADYVGDPQEITVLNKKVENSLLNRVLGEVGTPKRGTPEGWLMDKELKNKLSPKLNEEVQNFHRLEAHSTWHTPLTGIYSVMGRPAGVWFNAKPDMPFELQALDSRMEVRPSTVRFRKRLPFLDGLDELSKQ